MRIRVRLAEIKQDLIQQRNRLAIQRRTLATLIGVDHQSVKVAGNLKVDTSIPLTQPSTQRALAQRDDYQAQAASVKARTHEYEAARGARWPQVSLRASYGGRFGIDADRPAGVDDADDVATVGIIGTIPLFDGGRIASNALRQRFALSEQQQRLRQLRLRIGLEVETAWRNIQAASQRIDANRVAIEQAKESLRIERVKYDQGKGTIVDILDAEAAMLQTQTNYYRALGDRRVALTQLKLAMGTLP